ncbi:MAG TPA: hypothetical protein VD971_12480 [Phycisphaerales bacterium]|nr:hypothetical protein [Phycisphaerales bacterium]
MRRLAAISCTALLTAPASAQPVTTAFTYQGQLASAGVPAEGPHDLRFRLYTAGGAQIGPTLCADDVAVAAGQFAALLDFGASAFDGQQRFVEVDVRADAGLDCTDATGYTTLTPRQPITATPHASYAINAAAADTALSATNATQLGGQPASFYTNATNLTTGTIADTRLSGNVPRLNTSNTFTAAVSAPSFAGSGASLTSLNASNLSAGTLADARLSGNVALLNAAQIFSAPKTFSSAPSFTAAGSPFTVASTSLVANLNADLLDGLSSGAFAPAAHTHAASDITSGVLPAARGGTNATSIGGAGQVAYSNGTSLLFSATGAPGMLLRSTGTGAPTWTTISAADLPLPGGDVNGPYTAMLVDGLQGRPVASNAPSAGDVLSWSGVLWAPAAPPTPTLGGDVAGAANAATVVGLRGRPVSGTSPAAGQVLTWTGTQWAPAALPSPSITSPETLRLIRGYVSTLGGITEGAGFTVAHPALGEYDITFSPAFSDRPVIAVTVEDAAAPQIATFTALANGSVTIRIWQLSGGAIDSGFHFTAVGPP